MGILQFCKSKDKRSIPHLISILNKIKISQIHQLPHAELIVQLPTSENLVNACRGSLSILNTEAHWRFEFDDTVPRSIGAHNYTLLFQPEQIKMDSWLSGNCSQLRKNRNGQYLRTRCAASSVAGFLDARSLTSSIPINSPTPLQKEQKIYLLMFFEITAWLIFTTYRTSPMSGCLVWSWSSSCLRWPPTCTALPLRSSFSRTSNTARPMAQDTGLPPNFMGQKGSMFT